MRRIAFTATLGFALSSCSYIMFWKEPTEGTAATDGKIAEDGEKPAEVVDDPATHPQRIAELELKHAKLWARVDDLEESMLRQREKVLLLEKGALLGINLGAERKKSAKSAKVDAPPAAPEAKVEPEPVKPEKATVAPAAPPENAATMSADYQKKLDVAQNFYREGRYGKAIVEFANIDREFGTKVGDGVHNYWTARAWAQLGENQAARQHFAEFLEKHPDSPWASRAKLYLAKTELKLGLKDTAVKRYREIIQSHPNEESAEIAKLELQTMNESL